MNNKKNHNMQELPFKMTDALWKRMLVFLNNNYSRCVNDPEQCRLFLSAVMWITEEDLSWSAIPQVYGNRKTVYDRFRRWCNAGVFESMREHFQSLVFLEHRR